MSAPSLRQQIEQSFDSALARGAILPLQSEPVTADDAGMPYTISHLSSLSLKDMAAALQNSAGGNPFLPYEQDLFVANASDSHVLLLNKFPIERNHVMAVTRQFVPQVAPLDRSDFAALGLLLRTLDGLAMFNGGREAGASQPHKHIHMMPGRRAPLEAIFPTTGPVGQLQDVAAFDFLHAFARLDASVLDADALQEIVGAAATMCGLRVRNGEMPPYNLLATPRWLLLVPRSQATWSEAGVTLHVSALDFGGQLGVRGHEQIDVVRRAGLRAVLRATTVPR